MSAHKEPGREAGASWLCLKTDTSWLPKPLGAPLLVLDVTQACDVILLGRHVYARARFDGYAIAPLVKDVPYIRNL